MASFSARAIRQFRMSPGGGTPSSRTSRPDEPPSSATVTTAAISSAYSRAARNDSASPCPPPIPTTLMGPSLGWLAVDVAVDHLGREPLVHDEGADLLRQRDGAMSPPGAADRHSQVMTSLALVAGEQDGEQVLDPSQHVMCLLVAHDVVLDRFIQAGQRSELIDPVRIRKKPDVEHEVCVQGQPELVAERDHGRLETLRRVVAVEIRSETRSQFAHRDLGRIDDEVGSVPEAAHELPLPLNAGHEAIRERMASSARLEPLLELLVGCLEIHESVVAIVAPQLLELLGRLGEESAAAHVDHESDALYLMVGLMKDERQHFANQCGGKVVDNEPAEILERFGGLGPAGPRQTREDDYIDLACSSTDVHDALLSSPPRLAPFGCSASYTASATAFGTPCTSRRSSSD